MVDPSLLAAVQKGDHAAFKELYQSCIGYVYSIVKRYLSNNSDHPDVIQEIFARLFLSISTYDEEKGEFKFWLRRLVINQCLKNGRKGKSPKHLVPLELAHEIEGEDELPLHELTRAEIEEILFKMPDGYRQIFMLVIIDDYTHQEVGELLEISAETSRSQLSRAKSWLRKHMIHQHKFLSNEI